MNLWLNLGVIVFLILCAIVLIVHLVLQDRRDQRQYDVTTPPNAERWPPKIDP